MGGDGYVPQFRNIKTRDNRFIRGYAYDFGSGGAPSRQYLPRYGESLHKKMERIEERGFSVGPMGEALPRNENRVHIDKTVLDDWGIPALHISRTTPITSLRWRKTR